MKRELHRSIEQLEAAAIVWMARYGTICMRLSLGIIFLWFGSLKLVPDLSPAEGLAGMTIETLTIGIVPPEVSVPLLGLFESVIGICLLTRRALRLTIFSLLVHMMGTVLPFVLFPGIVFQAGVLSPTLEGQYIIKNLVIVSGALVVGATLHHRSARVRESITLPIVDGELTLK
jgi:uncharacterized membrane protein YphA (DoxX/SURF4 family)